KFGVDSQFKADKARYENEKKRKERLARLAELIAEKPSIIARIDNAVERFRAIEERVQSFQEQLGPKTVGRLCDMAKVGRSTVTGMAVNYKSYTYDNGEEKKERRAAPSNLGNLPGLQIFDDTPFRRLRADVREVLVAFDTAENIKDDVRTSEIEKLN